MPGIRLPEIHKIRRLNYNQKITLYLVLTVLIAALLILLTVSFSAGKTIKEKSAEMAMRQIESATKTVETTLGDFWDITTYIISDSKIQAYLRTGHNKAVNYTKLTNDAYHLLTYLMNSNSYLDYVCVYKSMDDSILYQGEIWTVPDFKQRMLEGYRRQNSTSDEQMRVCVEPSFFHPENYSMNIYHPIINYYDFDSKTGSLLISINQKRFSSIYAVSDPHLPFEIYITDQTGVIVSSDDESRIGSPSAFAGRLTGHSGSFEADGSMVVYSYIGRWDWYVVGSIPMEYLLKDTRDTMQLMIALILLICVTCFLLSGSMSNRLYRPLRELVGHMAKVSGGDLDTRMGSIYYGEDIETLTAGFNDMLDKIQTLMLRIKEEQHQIEQIKFNALQSQIKPHFLYNALDCIHWQSVVDGNREVSTMVKALATYYRLCLSKGQDLITLSQETAHVKSYLIIQNMRYDGILESEFVIDDEFSGVLIPKMTLQPLVENSIYHGIKVKTGKKGKITIRAMESEDKIVVTVEDTGIGIEQSRVDEINRLLSVHDESFGYGVRNVHKRIELLFGIEYGLFYRKNEDSGLTVEIRLPKTNDIQK